MTEGPAGVRVPAARLLSCPSVACRRNAFRVFLYNVRQNAAGDQLLTCLSCGYAAVFREGSGRFDPRPGRPAQDWRPPQPLDDGKSNPDPGDEEVDSEKQRRGAPPQGSAPAQLTITTNSEEEVETMNSQEMDKRNGEADAALKDSPSDRRDRHRPAKSRWKRTGATRA